VRDFMLKFGIVDFFCCIVAILHPYFELPIGRADISKYHISPGWVLFYSISLISFIFVISEIPVSIPVSELAVISTILLVLLL